METHCETGEAVHRGKVSETNKTAQCTETSTDSDMDGYSRFIHRLGPEEGSGGNLETELGVQVYFKTVSEKGSVASLLGSTNHTCPVVAWGVWGELNTAVVDAVSFWSKLCEHCRDEYPVFVCETKRNVIPSMCFARNHSLGKIFYFRAVFLPGRCVLSNASSGTRLEFLEHS
ncbi:MAG: uncharacterized protein A8A55_1903 [Amphiamblys sp. WSBS2006]|nr:MAG: uncharacterized protein A8A55_1903 [Amphiamblys sp. WSBS2006]